MGITAISWDIPDDIHIVRGKSSRRLDKILRIFHDGIPTNPPSPPPPPPTIIPLQFHASDTATLAIDGTKVTFQPPPFKSPTTVGFTIDPTTGVVTSTNPTPTTRPRNFIVKAIVSKTGSTDPLIPPILIRIHIHEAIVDAFVTPSTLTARKKDSVPGLGVSSVFFSVFATFDAGGTNPDNKVIGDITRIEGLEWSSSSASLDVDKDSGAIDALVDTAAAPLPKVQVKLPADLGSLVREGSIQPAESWGTQRTAKLQSGSKTSPAVPGGFNLLILPDGFMTTAGNADQTKFEDLARDFFTQWTKSKTLEPFVTMPINLYTCWVPSRQRGTTVRNLLRYASRNTKKRAMPLILNPNEPPVANPRVIKTVQELILQVGLPTPEDATANQAAKTTEWTSLYPASHFDSVSTTVFKQWTQRADYVLAFERDTAFGIASGETPQASTYEDGRAGGFHPLRARRNEIDKLLTFLVDSAGNNIGSKWLTGSGRLGVAILTAGGRYAGGRERPPNELIVDSLNNSKSSKLVATTGRQIPDLDPFEPPKDVPLRTLARMTHETAHAFSCGDEYGGLTAISTTRRADSRKSNPNLHDEADIADASGNILVTSISWVFWPRIASAGLVIKPVATVVPPFYEVTIRSDPRSKFQAEDTAKKIDGDTVRLRHRPFYGLDDLQPNHLKYLDESIDFTVTQVTKVTDGVVIRIRKRTSTDVFTPTDWKANEAILFKPLDTFMVHDKVVQFINDSKVPLNRKKAIACKPGDDSPLQQVAAPVTGLVKGSDPGIVGIFDGGTELYCGIYHPTGTCMMRAFQTNSQIASGELNTFCPICRYIIVDFIDPAMHAQMNADYQNIYPKAK